MFFGAHSAVVHSSGAWGSVWWFQDRAATISYYPPSRRSGGPAYNISGADLQLSIISGPCQAKRCWTAVWLWAPEVLMPLLFSGSPQYGRCRMVPCSTLYPGLHPRLPGCVTMLCKRNSLMSYLRRSRFFGP